MPGTNPTPRQYDSSQAGSSYAGPNQGSAALSGAVALITGASRGIGLAIARRLGGLGARVALCARNPARLEQARQGLAADDIEAIAHTADVTRPADITALLQQVHGALGPVDILVNNAGIGIFGPFQERSEEEWDQVVNTNLKSVFLMSRAVAPEMIQRRSGHIVNVSSLAGKNAFAGGGIYCASKWGLMGLTYCMAEELRNYSVRVSVVCPGSVATEFSAHPKRDPATLLQPDDVAQAVITMLTSAPTSFISEINLRPMQKS